MVDIDRNLAHPAKELDQNIEKQSLHTSSDHAEILDNKAMDEKPHQSSGSESSAQDAPQLQKLDSEIVTVEKSDDDDAPYAHLPLHERGIIKEQLHIPDVTVTYTRLFRYATRTDIAIISFSSLCAITGGAALPLMTVSCDRCERAFFPANLG